MLFKFKMWIFKKVIGVNLIDVVEYQNWRIDELKELVDWLADRVDLHQSEKHKPVKKSKACKGKCKKK
jgi:hypothetical protein